MGCRVGDESHYFSQDEVDKAIQEALRLRDHQDAEAAERKLVEDVASTVDRLSGDLSAIKEAMKELQRRMAEVRLHFGLQNLGELDMRRFPELLRWWGVNEPIIKVLVQRTLAEDLITERRTSWIHSRQAKVGIWTAVTAGAAGVIQAVISFIQWIHHH
jgi:hypothetical protein